MYKDNFSRTVKQLLQKLNIKEKISLLSGQDNWHSFSLQEQGISRITVTDGPHGVRCEKNKGRPFSPATAFPPGVALASSWDRDLLFRVGQALADETLAVDCDILLGPCVNIVRHPLGGRNFESYSEDPFLAGEIGKSWIKGVQSKEVGTSLKHFACNNQEENRMQVDICIDERTLREIYLPAFETIVKEQQPWTVMCAYNRLNGEYCSANTKLLTKILRDEWGFNGVVISDWGAVHQIYEPVKAGLELEMPGPAKYFGSLLYDAFCNWFIDEQSINRAAGRVLALLEKCGKLGKAKKRATGCINTVAHQKLAKETALSSITLLKNDGLLPFNPKEIKTLALIGPNISGYMTGGGSSYVPPPYSVGLLESLQADKKLDFNLLYEKGCDNFTRIPQLGLKNIKDPIENSPGFRTEYFNNTECNGQPVLSILDDDVPGWGFQPPEGINHDQFSLAIKGKLLSENKGRHVIGMSFTQEVKLYLDGKLIKHASASEEYDYQQSHGFDFAFEMEAGKEYDLQALFIRKTEGPNVCQLNFAYQPLEKDDRRMENAVTMAKKADAVIFCGGLPSLYESEGKDRLDMELPGKQNELVEKLLKVNQKLLFVLNCGAPVSLPWLDKVPALLHAYYPGMEGGNALKEIIFGERSPSGKLTVSYPKRLEDSPAFLHYPGEKQVRYAEGIYCGYRYFDKKKTELLFPFGHGLSYSTFEYSKLDLPSQSSLEKPLEVRMKIKNSGEYKASEIVQLYVHDQESELNRPEKELKGFAKIELAPGQTGECKFLLDKRAFSYYHPEKADWFLEPGIFTILIASSSRDIRLKADLEITG